MGSRGGYRQSPQGLRITHVMLCKSRLKFPGITVNLVVREYRRFDGSLLPENHEKAIPKMVLVEGNLGCMAGTGDEDIAHSQG